MLKKSLFWGMTAVLILASFGFMGCAEESDPLKSGEKSIIAFKVNNVEGVIDEDAKRIAVTLPSNSAVTALSPIAVVSKAAQIIDPATGEVIGEAGAAVNERQLPPHDFTVGKNYVVKAEDGSTQTYYVEVTVLPMPPVPPAVVLQSLSVIVSKTYYDYNEAFDNGSLVLTGSYSDGSKKVEPVDSATITGYDKAAAGTQNLIVAIGDIFTTFQVTVLPEPPEEADQAVEVTIALPNSAEEPVVYGIPEGGIILTRYGVTADTPNMVLISVGGSDLWTGISWNIDGQDYSNDNIITIHAWDDYTLTQPHTITFTGYKGGVEYSKTISFTVVK
ncbi:MAG: bacterial Ig-like domain-containing protein [Treponema sp.]|jgi:hypothetical protein|nr:bacterial Ig-like domain-containing protein [Treponema sp.]